MVELEVPRVEPVWPAGCRTCKRPLRLKPKRSPHEECPGCGRLDRSEPLLKHRERKRVAKLDALQTCEIKGSRIGLPPDIGARASVPTCAYALMARRFMTMASSPDDEMDSTSAPEKGNWSDSGLPGRVENISRVPSQFAE